VFLWSLDLCCFLLVAGIYVFAAVIWDELENEDSIYNYNRNFALIDFCVWRLIPAFALLLLLRRLTAIFKNNDET
jgi:hypothetical protein